MSLSSRFDEEKSVECHICERSFKNGAALNGHMRLHGGFHEVGSLTQGFIIERTDFPETTDCRGTQSSTEEKTTDDGQTQTSGIAVVVQRDESKFNDDQG